MKSKKLNKDKLITFLFVIFGVAFISLLAFRIYEDFYKKNSNITVQLAKLELYGYILDKSDTKLYKQYFGELEEVLKSKNINYKTYAELLSKLYIVDFYTLNNKMSSTDIGSLEFVHPDIVDNFKLKAKDTVYKYIKVNYDGKREQSLPEVKSVKIKKIIDTEYVYNEKIYDGYQIECSWTYEEDLGYQTKSLITVIKDGTKLYVSESN